ncbi:hypothetical protein ACWDZ4_13540 [Streptomyces sp. NPDC003016]
MTQGLLCSPIPDSELQRINSFLTAFARRQAARIVDLPGGFAVYDDAFAHSRANNRAVIDTAFEPEVLPALAEEAPGHLPHRVISVLDDEVTMACAEPLVRAGYTHSTYPVMLQPVPVEPRSTAVLSRLVRKSPSGAVRPVDVRRASGRTAPHTRVDADVPRVFRVPVTIQVGRGR